MPKIHELSQGTDEWLSLRVGKVTASELGNLLTPLMKQRDGEMPKTYLYTKLAEAYRGTALPGFSSWATEQGQELEARARSWFALEFDGVHNVRNVGFVEHDSGRCGCSPDALLDDDGGLELKCPETVNHVRYLLDGTLPKDYAAQVHGSIYVTGRPWWKFVSYSKGFPPFVLTVNRDEEICAQIEKTLEKFYKDFDAALAKLRNTQ